MVNSIRKVGVAGAGTMGLGIAQVIAMAGYPVALYDINANVLETAFKAIKSNLEKGVSLEKLTDQEAADALGRIQPINDIKELKGDLVIEAVVEQLEVKIDLFTEIEKNNAPGCILASNTSSIPITQIAAGLQNPKGFIGMHFFNPAHIMKLVEIIPGAQTDPDVFKIVREFTVSLGKTPVVASDAPGFIVNRVARHFYVESLKLLEEKVADHEAIDKLMEATGFRMGPFRLMDLIGIDTNFAVTNSMYNAFYQDPKFRPSRIQKQKVDARQLGKKSGSGFYNY